MSHKYLQQDWHLCRQTAGLQDTPYTIHLSGCHLKVRTHVQARINARCDPHTGVAHIPITNIAKLCWHCRIRMSNSGSTALYEARKICARIRQQRQLLKLNHMATEHIIVWHMRTYAHTCAHVQKSQCYFHKQITLRMHAV